MTPVPGRSEMPGRIGQLAQASAHRRRWARDAALLQNTAPEVRPDPVVPGTLPDWVGAPAACRLELAVLAGAMLRARRLRRTIDGRVLAALAGTIGERRVDAVMVLCGRAPPVNTGPWQADVIGQLHALGGEVLVRGFDGPESIRKWLAALFPPSDLLARLDPAALRRVGGDAQMLWDWREPGRDPAEES